MLFTFSVKFWFVCFHVLSPDKYVLYIFKLKIPNASPQKHYLYTNNIVYKIQKSFEQLLNNFVNDVNVKIMLNKAVTYKRYWHFLLH